METLATFWGRYLAHVVDIGLVSYLVYQLLLLIQGTRAVQIAYGIIVVALMTVLSQAFGLSSLQWLLQKFWIAGAVVIAVLFQPELRSALARLGGKTAHGFFSHHEMLVVNEVVGAIKESSRRQMGMLIAIERDTGLREYIESGTLVMGEVSRELLLTVFQPPSALHDGAVIIQGNRIAAAGCILPVSQDPTVSKLLGTRHRAAVGITEVSDALAVCVSEETGNISVAREGRLLTQLDADDVRQHLLNMFRAEEKRPSNS